MLGSLSQRVGSESTLALAANRVDLSPCVARQARCPTSPRRRSILCFLCLLCLLPATRLFLQTERKAWRFPNSFQPFHPNLFRTFQLSNRRRALYCVATIRVSPSPSPWLPPLQHTWRWRFPSAVLFLALLLLARDLGLHLLLAWRRRF